MVKKIICPVCASEKVEEQYGFNGVVACREDKIPTESAYHGYLCENGHIFDDVPEYASEQ